MNDIKLQPFGAYYNNLEIYFVASNHHKHCDYSIIYNAKMLLFLLTTNQIKSARETTSD